LLQRQTNPDISGGPGLTPLCIAANFILLGAKRGSVGGRQLVR
jgi:hypothetical protein